MNSLDGMNLLKNKSKENTGKGNYMTEPIEVSKTHMLRDDRIGAVFLATIIQPGYASFQPEQDMKQTALKLDIELHGGKRMDTYTFPSVDALNQFIRNLARISEMMIDEDVDFRIRNK